MDPVILLTVIFFWSGVSRTRAGPLSALNDISSNAINEDVAAEEAPVLDDFTTHGLERLSSAATCLVAGVEYTHGQQIYRKDPCEFCLCLDGEMFCWWQDCPPTMEGPCKDRGPFTPCINIPLNEYSALSLSPASSSSATTTLRPSPIVTSSPPISSTDSSENSTESASTDEISASTAQENEEVSTLEDETKSCIVMGRRYEVGAKLPHTTGNCVECICGQGAQVTCSPHQCAPIGDDINDYRPPGPRQVPEVF